MAELTLEADDLAAMVAFYTDLLGLEVLSRDCDRVWLRAGAGVRLGIWAPGAHEHGDRGGRHVHFAFSAAPECLGEIAARLKARGLHLEGPVEHDGGDRSLYFRDPAGNLVEAWDYFRREPGAREGTAGLAEPSRRASPDQR